MVKGFLPQQLFLATRPLPPACCAGHLSLCAGPAPARFSPLAAACPLRPPLRPRSGLLHVCAPHDARSPAHHGVLQAHGADDVQALAQMPAMVVTCDRRGNLLSQVSGGARSFQHQGLHLASTEQAATVRGGGGDVRPPRAAHSAR